IDGRARVGSELLDEGADRSLAWRCGASGRRGGQVCLDVGCAIAGEMLANDVLDHLLGPGLSCAAPVAPPHAGGSGARNVAGGILGQDLLDLTLRAEVVVFEVLYIGSQTTRERVGFIERSTLERAERLRTTYEAVSD